MSLTDDFFALASKKTQKRFWLISDLQQRDPVRAKRYFETALADYRTLNLKVDGICYLGDAAEGVELSDLEKMIDMQISGLEQFQLPIYYVMGNHEFDYYRKCVNEKIPPRIPFYEKIHSRPLWHCTANPEEFYYMANQGEFIMLFFSDHAAKDGSWLASHQFLTDAPNYPHSPEKWRQVRDEVGRCGKTVFTFSHYPYPGGNRESQYLAQLLPLPENFRAHFYGHAHIGDGDWAAENLYRKISGTNHNPVNQFDVASLDHLRGTTVRSAFFDYCGNNEYSVFWRDHLNRRWEDCYVQSVNPRESGIPEKLL